MKIGKEEICENILFSKVREMKFDGITTVAILKKIEQMNLVAICLKGLQKSKRLVQKVNL